jgi:hypothetical protein
MYRTNRSNYSFIMNLLEAVFMGSAQSLSRKELALWLRFDVGVGVSWIFEKQTIFRRF